MPASSVTVTSSIASVGRSDGEVSSPSSSMMVALPSPSSSVALRTPLRRTVKVSFTSSSPSSTTGTASACTESPGSNVRVPLTAV